jgi:lipid-A-disaccharide synthase
MVAREANYFPLLEPCYGVKRVGPSILCVAGELSGDIAIARVLAHMPQVRAFGMGGDAMRACGVELLAHLEATAEMGLTEVARKIPRLIAQRQWLLHAAKARSAKAALLFNYSEFNASLLRPLAALGIPALFYSPPQVWAWRPKRARTIAAEATAIACIFPFEAPMWTAAGGQATYVGHPALEIEWATQAQARCDLRLGSLHAPLVALLPGSRPAEVRRNLPIMLDAVRQMHHTPIHAHALVAPSLPRELQIQVRATCGQAGVATTTVSGATGLATMLPAFDLAVAASGTVTLESVLADVPPIIVHRVAPLTAFVGRHLLQTSHIGLPNILLGRDAFPELLQARATGKRLAEAIQSALTLARKTVDRGRCASIRHYLQAPGSAQPSSHVAHMLAGLL